MKQIIVTGVSRKESIGPSVVRQLLADGHRVIVHGFSPFDSLVGGYRDASQTFTELFVKSLQEQGYDVDMVSSSDLSNSYNAERLIHEANSKFGEIQGLVQCHAYSKPETFEDITAEEMKMHFDVNVVSGLKLIQAFTKQKKSDKQSSIVMFTSGQYLGLMKDELSYAISKDAIITIVRQTACLLMDSNIQINAINPGPTDTGYATGSDYEAVRDLFPLKRWGIPQDVANLVSMLMDTKAQWITGEVIASEGGFRR